MLILTRCTIMTMRSAVNSDSFTRATSVFAVFAAFAARLCWCCFVGWIHNFNYLIFGIVYLLLFKIFVITRWPFFSDSFFCIYFSIQLILYTKFAYDWIRTSWVGKVRTANWATTTTHCLTFAENTRHRGGSITVQLTSCLTGLDSTKQVKLILIQLKQSGWIQTKQTVFSG